MTGGPTNFLESNALLALMSGDEAEARRLLSSGFPGELRWLEVAATKLADLCNEILLARDNDAHRREGSR